MMLQVNTKLQIRIAKFIGIIIAISTSMSIPIISVQNVNEIFLVNKKNYSFISETINQKPIVDSQIITFHSNNKIIKINEKNNMMQSFLIQNKQASAFLTYPIKGSFFVEYPRLGRVIKIYDTRGDFLWKINESRYLKVFDSGDWILGLSGDHSKLHFFKPDMSKYMELEGYLLTQYHINEALSREADSYNACLSFLAGDVVFIRLNSKTIERHTFPSAVKNIFCDFNSGNFLVQVYDVKLNKHFLILKNLHHIKKDIFITELPHDTFYTTPMAFNANNLLYIYWNSKIRSFYFNLLNFHDGSYINFPLSADLKLEDIDLFRIKQYQDSFLVYNKQSTWFFDTKGLIYTKNFHHIKKIFINTDKVYVQNEESITLFQQQNKLEIKNNL